MFEVVTTFNQDKHGYFSDKMLQTFDLYWKKSINLFAYIQNPKKSYNVGKNIKIIDFENISEKFNFFKFNYNHKELSAKIKSYKFEAIRFAHKIYALKHHIEICKSNYLIWLDSDVISFKNIDEKFLSKLTDENIYFSYLGRKYINFHSEAGFMIFNTKHKYHNEFWQLMSEMYDDGKLFDEKEWHDSYIFDVVRSKLEKKNMKTLDISTFGLNKGKDPLEVLDNSVLGEFMKHLKGNRKQFL